MSEQCKGCNGYGMVGNILDSDTCPFCKGDGAEPVTATLPAAPAPTEQAESSVAEMRKYMNSLKLRIAELEDDLIVTEQSNERLRAALAARQAPTVLRRLSVGQIDAIARECEIALCPELLLFASKVRAHTGGLRGQAPDSRDAALLDWLETKVVNVRDPLRYGSRDNFWATPEDRDGDENGPSGLREQCIAAIAQEKAQ